MFLRVLVFSFVWSESDCAGIWRIQSLEDVLISWFLSGQLHLQVFFAAAASVDEELRR